MVHSRSLLAVVGLLSVTLMPLAHGTAQARHFSFAADERILRQATVLVNHHRDALSWLRRQPRVRDAERGADGRTITIHMRDGLTQAILPATAGTSTYRVTRPQRAELVNQATSGGQRALVLAPFAWQYQAFATTDQVASLLTQAGFQTTELVNSQVTVDVMKSIADYKVVYISGHAGWLGDGTVVVSTGQVASPDGGPYLNDISKGVMIIGSVAGDDGVHLFYDIAPGFINSYVGQFGAHSMVLMNGCGTSYSQSMSQALLAHGVTTYTGWTSEVNSPDMERGGYAVMYGLSTGHMTVGQAVDRAVAAGLATSEIQGVPTQMVLSGDSTLTLQEAAAPDPTPTPVPPTATTTPTPTPTPTKKASLSKPDLHTLRFQLSTGQLRMGVTTPLTVTVSASGYKVRNLRVSLNGRSVKAGYHSHVTDAAGSARFRERPRMPGSILGSITRPHMNPLTFKIRVIK